MANRIGICRAITALCTTLLMCLFSCCAPIVSFADEPSSALDIDDEAILTEGPTSDEINQVLDAISNDYDQGISLLSDGTSTSVIEEYSGKDRFEVSYEVARTAFPSGSSNVIIAGEDGWADALSATSLAGMMDCPVILVPSKGISVEARQLLNDLRVTNAVIVGGPKTVSDKVMSELDSMGISARRIGGADRYEVSSNIFKYCSGKWSSDFAIVATGTVFSDALSASSLAYANKAPVLLVDGSKGFSADESSRIKDAVASGEISGFLIVGGRISVPENIASLLRSYTSNVQRIDGADRYEVSSSLAEWSVEHGYLTWDIPAFTSGNVPFDALSGCSLQGKRRGVILLVNSTSDSTVSAMLQSGAKRVAFLGGSDSISPAIRAFVMSGMNLVSSYDAGISLEQFATLQSKINKRHTYAELLESMDPLSYQYGSAYYYQFADISKGYSGKVNAEQINSFLSSVCSANGYQTSTLLNQGDAIIQAAKNNNLNEVYLLAHAILESGWGMSKLAQGSVSGYEGYYNFYGIGAYDIDPNNGGAALAKSRGWDSPAKALNGAAQWISKNYTFSSYRQNTLYKMRWNYVNGNPGHQYATDRLWASSIARVMGQFYSYLGYGPSESGLSFLIPVYR